MGLLKLVTCGGCLVWWLLDAFSAKKRCRQRNCEAVFALLRGAAVPQSAPVQPVQQPPVQPVRPTVVTAGPVQAPTAQTGTAPAPEGKPESGSATPKPVTSRTPDVFLSYSHRDKDRLMPLFGALARSGLNIWYDEGIRAGTEWEEEIIEHLSKAPSFLFFVTEHSLHSSNCRDELYQARKKEKRFINVLVDDVDFSKQEFEWFDFRYSRYQQIPAYSLPMSETIEKIHNGLKK